ncbi:MAG: DUF1549 domain-containing protein [Isosphaeraceae bacterium]|nr:DUF1549 domain-containing protein [Isosphaeraceae bacterium]
MRVHSRKIAFGSFVLLQFWMVASIRGAADPAEDRARLDFFEKQVRPILSEKCFSCHGPEKQKGGLRLDSREAILQGGDSGPAVEPGRADESLLIEAVRRTEALSMPPKGALAPSAIEALVRWVDDGAHWPSTGTRAGVAAGVRPRGSFSDEDRSWWAIQPLRVVESPDVERDGWARGAIDRFVLAELSKRSLEPAPEADRTTLIRRLSFDLIGLPPTPAEVEAFVSDPASDAYERLVERLLASPRYGERWARHWLDLVRYAESDGYRADHYRPEAWHYRDYVIRSFNEDKPYDRFLREQIAGDELYPGDSDASIALGYLRHGIYEYNNRDARTQWATILGDVTDTTADVFLGLGLQCAKCHDHKFDPLLQVDYYRLQAFFAPMFPRDDLSSAGPGELEAYREALAAWEEKSLEIRREIEELERPFRRDAAESAITKFPDDIQAIARKADADRTPLERQLAWFVDRQIDFEYSRLETFVKGPAKEKLVALGKRLAALESSRPAAPPKPPTVRDVGPIPPPTTLPKRPGEAIEPGIPSILDARPLRIEPIPGVASTGRRAALANWLADPTNPLTARVIVNRVWQHHFGRGLAANPSDFGRLGEPPSHPALLDRLADQFIRSGMRIKDLHREIVNSSTYRQSSDHPEAERQRLIDPDNRLLWRGATRRLAAEQIRDAILAATGELQDRAGGEGVLPTAPRRSIYTRVLRNSRDPLLESFDLPLFFTSEPTRETTTTPLQSLYLINSPAMLDRSKAFANRLVRETGPSASAADRVEAAYKIAFGRTPSSVEREEGAAFLEAQAAKVDLADASRPETTFRSDRMPKRDGRAAVFDGTPSGARLEIPHRPMLEANEFTIEAYVLVRSVAKDAGVRTIAAKWNGDPKSSGWSFGVTGQASRHKPRVLVLQLFGDRSTGGPGEEVAFSDQALALDRPYYVAAVVERRGPDRSASTVTFHIQELTSEDEPLLTSRVAHRSISTSNREPLSIGGRSARSSAPFHGLIDDVRFSAEALPPNRLAHRSESVGPRLMGHWRFDLDSGVYADSSGHGLEIRPVEPVKSRIDPANEALADFCHVLLNSSEFLYVP